MKHHCMGIPLQFYLIRLYQQENILFFLRSKTVELTPVKLANSHTLILPTYILVFFGSLHHSMRWQIKPSALFFSIPRGLFIEPPQST